MPATAVINLDQYGNVLPPAKGTKQALLVLGADGPLGRDELVRVLDGARTSLEIAIGAVLIALLIAIPVGSIAGYFGGATDAVVSRFTETVMAFPLLLFLVFATAKLSPTLRGVSYGWILPSGVFAEALLIGAFTSFYPTRLVRAQLVTLRNAEFVEAAHMIGTSDWRILRRHLYPHLVPTLLVWAPIAVATNILLEVGLSFIGVGVQPSTPTWGSLLATAWGTVYSPQSFGHTQTAWQTIIPTTAILITVLSLNQVSEGVRRATEPWGAAMRRIVTFVARRLAAAIFTMLMLVAIAFVVYWALPSTPAAFVYPSSQHLTQYQLTNANHLLGLDRPKIVQYGDYVAHLARGDLGHEWTGAELSLGTSSSRSPSGACCTPRSAQRCRSSSAGRSSCCCWPSRSGRSRAAVSARSATGRSRSSR